MSQKTGEIDTCHIVTCRKPWLSHHTFNSFTGEGRPSFHCHTEPVAAPDPVVAYIIGLRTDKLQAQNEIKELKKKHVLDMQASKAELERSFESKVRAEAAKQAAVDIEKTRVQMESTHVAKVSHLEDVLKEVRGDKQLLIADKSALTAKLDAGDQKALDLQLEIDELKTDLQEERRQYEDLKRDSKEVLRLAFAIGDHAATLGRKLGIDGEADIEELFAKKADPRPPIEVEDLTAKPVPAATMPIPTPVPKAVVVTAHVAAPQAAPAPVPPANMVVLDAPTPEPESSASADDEDDGQDDGAIIDEMVAGSDADEEVSFEEEGSTEDDGASSEEEGPEECRGCEKAATHGFDFALKNGETDRLTTCDPAAHVGEFLGHLMKVAKVDPDSALKRIPKNTEALERLFKANPLNPNQ